MKNHISIFFSVFICSASALAYQIALTRVFSISLSYHFAFMVISVAMLGIGASGTLLSLYPRLKNTDYIPTYNLLLGIWISLGYLISNQLPFDPVALSWSPLHFMLIGLYAVTIAVPFFFAGLIVITALSTRTEKSALFYGADLLGAGLGSSSVILLLHFLMPETVIFIVSFCPLSAAFFAGGKKMKVTAMLIIIITVFLLFMHPSFTRLRISPYKPLQTALLYPGAEHLKTYVTAYSRIDALRSPAVRFAPGMSLQYLEKLPDQVGLSIDGGELTAITRRDDTDALKFLRYLPSSLSYELTRKKDGKEILILDPKGGLQALMAEYYRFTDVISIESNPLILKVVNEDFRSFSGGLYDTNTKTGFGRSWLAHQKKEFDLIDIQHTSSYPSASFGIAEDYRFTVEAFKEYLRHLKPEGFLSIHTFILPPPRIELRLLNTAIDALKEFGINDPAPNIASIRSWSTIYILIKRSPLTSADIETIRHFSRERRFDLVYLPNIEEKETNLYIKMPVNEYFYAFQNIMNQEKRADFIETYPFDTKPVHDDNPFFNYYLEVKNTREIFQLMGRKWQYFLEEGYIIHAVLFQVLLASILLIILPVFAARRARVEVKELKYPARTRSYLLLPYFALIAIGFMFIEISLIQKVILSFEHPAYAVAIVLTSLLMSSGFGSLCSHAMPSLKSPPTLFIVAALASAYAMLIQTFTVTIAPLAFSHKFALMFLAAVPLGFFMGIPFPVGLKILSDRDASLIPWAWAMNGCFSVLAPVLAVLIALSFGFSFVLWCGALAYLLAFATLMLRFPTASSGSHRSSVRTLQAPTAQD